MKHLALATISLLAVGCRAPAPVAVAPSQPRVTRSNILRGDYVGSAACAPCHAEVFAKWAASPMHKMTRDPEQVETRAPFAGESFVFKGDRATLFREGHARFMRLSSPREGEHLFHVTRVIGNHYREDFAGVEVASPATPVERGRGNELVLPVTYFFDTASYRPKGYSVMTHERPGLHAGGTWNRTCIFCHNTVPYFDTVWGALAGPSAPAYQGEVVDRVLPPDRRFRYTVTHEAAFLSAIAQELTVVGAPSPSTPDIRGAARAGIRALAASFTGHGLVEEGIGCESCHGGGREHAADPAVRTSYEPRSDFLSVAPAAGGPASPALLINRTCARCHQVLFSRYPFTWEGGLRRHGSPGGSSTTSGEARDFLLGGPGAAMPCTACHDPHGLDGTQALHKLATPAGNAVCVTCHKGLATPERLAEHAHHDPKGPAGSCVGCHMPRKNMALDYSLTRYHRIGSPTDRERVEGDRPLECALCHVDKSTARLVDDMERWWGKRYERSRLRELYGDLDANPLVATLERGRPHEQVVAAMVLAEHKVATAATGIARLALSPYPLVRRYAARALAELREQPCALDVDASPDEIRSALAVCGLQDAPGAIPIQDRGGPAAEPARSGSPAESVDED